MSQDRGVSGGLRAPGATASQPPPTQPAAHSVVESRGQDQILRFRRSERLLHWAIAIPFMVCWLSAMVLVNVYNPNSKDLPLRELLSMIHKISGVLLFVLPLIAILTHPRDLKLHFYNLKQGWIWTLADIKWLSLQGLAAINKNLKLPDQGKFNAGEKLNFMMVTVSCPVFIVTGALIWLPGTLLSVWYVHYYLGLVVTLFMLGHIYMATVNPDTKVGLSGMISGYMNRIWARHHYTRWFREHFESDEAVKPRKELDLDEACEDQELPVERPVSARPTDVEPD